MNKTDFKELLLWLLGRRSRFHVEGHSMLPLMKPGDEILMKPTKSLSIGDIVVVQHPKDSQKRLVKKVDAILESGKVVIKGINPSDSADSRSFGPIESSKIIGKVTSVLLQSVGAIAYVRRQETNPPSGK